MAADEAERHGIAGTFEAAWITLTVHSDLAAVGFLAAALAGGGFAVFARLELAVPFADLLLNLFHNGRLKAMPPKLLSDDGKNILIRPLAYCKEKDIAEYAELKEFPIIPCNLCGSQANLQRAHVNQMLRDWDKQFPQRLDSMFTAIQNIAPSQLADSNLFDFVGLEAKRESMASTFTDENRLKVVNITM